MATILVPMLVLSHADDAEAFTSCNEGCAVAAYAIITGGGLVTAAGAQLSLFEGDPSREWGYVSLGFAGANAATSGVLLLVAGVMALSDDDDAPYFAGWGGIQMSIAIAGLVSGGHAVASAPPSPSTPDPPRWSGASITIDF